MFITCTEGFQKKSTVITSFNQSIKALQWGFPLHFANYLISLRTLFQIGKNTLALAISETVNCLNPQSLTTYC